MKKIMRRMIPLITFELPLQYEHIERLFVTIQHNEQQRYSGWSAQATLKKATSYYWYQYVLIHFSLIFGLGCLISLPTSVFRSNATSPSLIMLPIGGVIIFFILMMTHYTPFYYNDFYLNCIPLLQLMKEANWHNSKSANKPNILTWL